MCNILLAITLSFDALGIGIAYSLKGIKIPLISKGIIFLISFVFAFLSIILGKHLTLVFSPLIAKMIGVVILFGIGIYTALGDPFSYDVDNSSKIDVKEALIMGFALSVDSIGVGIGSAIAGFSCSILPFSISICQFIFLYLGQLIGNHILINAKIKNKLWTVLSGVIIIIIAILRLF